MEKLAAETDCTGLDIIDHAGAALNGVWVTQHAPAVYFKFPKRSKGGGSLWDFAASACVLEQWGTSATDIYGNPIDLNRSDDSFMNELGIIYASDVALGKAIQDLFCRILPQTSLGAC